MSSTTRTGQRNSRTPSVDASARLGRRIAWREFIGIRRADALWLRDRLLPCLCLGMLVAFVSVCLRSPYFLVRTVKVTGVTGQIAADVAIKADIADQNIFALNAKRVQERIQAMPQIASVGVHINMPNSLSIDVLPYVPAAIWVVGGRNIEITADGMAIVEGDNLQLPHLIDQTRQTLPHGAHVDVQALQAVVALRPVFATLKLHPTAYTIDAPRSLLVTFDGGYSIEFDTSGDLQRQANTLVAFLRRSTPFTLLDLRPGDTPYWR